MSLSRKKRKDCIKKSERSQSFSLDSTIPTSPSNSTTKSHLQSRVYPALLSKVAYAFKENMVVGTKTKDSIKYHEVFDGKDAVVNLSIIYLLNFDLLLQ
jgi:hypothetical protein